jgi:hypothetical protein
MQALLDKAVEFYRRQRFLEESNRAFEALRADRSAWMAEEAERDMWDITLADDLNKECLNRRAARSGWWILARFGVTSRQVSDRG